MQLEFIALFDTNVRYDLLHLYLYSLYMIRFILDGKYVIDNEINKINEIFYRKKNLKRKQQQC